MQIRYQFKLNHLWLQTAFLCFVFFKEKHSEADRDDARWLRSKQLFTTIKYCMTDLQRALAHTGNYTMFQQHGIGYRFTKAVDSIDIVLFVPDSTSRELSAAASSSLSRLMDRILDQSETACEDNEDTLIKRLEHGLDKLTPPESNTKVLMIKSWLWIIHDDDGGVTQGSVLDTCWCWRFNFRSWCRPSNITSSVSADGCTQLS